MSKTALVLIDIQNDYFSGGALEVHKMDEATGNAVRLLENARENGDLVVHVRHEKKGDDAAFLREGTAGADIHDSVSPMPGEKVITKFKPNSFQDTDLLAYLTENQISKVVICGAMSQMCIDATTRAASDFGFDSMVVEDACAARAQVFDGVDVTAQQVHASFMAALGAAYATIVKTETYIGTS